MLALCLTIGFLASDVPSGPSLDRYAYLIVSLRVVGVVLLYGSGHLRRFREHTRCPFSDMSIFLDTIGVGRG
jgi:hypothetical protein